jgi:lipoprotein signal peptidase
MIELIKKRYFLLFAIIFLADRLTKWWAVTALADGPRAVCYGINFELSWNRGMMWRFLEATSGGGLWLRCTGLALLIAGIIWFIIWRLNRHVHVGWEVLALVGCFSMLTDCLWYGATVDFISWNIAPFSWPLFWPMFNIAGACIWVGSVGLSIKMIRESHD